MVAKNIAIMTPKITQEWRICFNMRPYMKTSAKGKRQRFIIVRNVDQAVGFS